MRIYQEDLGVVMANKKSIMDCGGAEEECADSRDV